MQSRRHGTCRMRLLLVGPKIYELFYNICPRRFRQYSERTGCNVNVQEWGITHNNLNVKFNDVKNTFNKFQWELENTPFF